MKLRNQDNIKMTQLYNPIWKKLNIAKYLLLQNLCKLMTLKFINYFVNFFLYFDVIPFIE